MEETVKERILDLAEEDFRKFQSRILPNVDNILGVRLPALRKIAKEISRGDWRGYMASAPGDYFEEILLQGLVLGYVKTDIEEILRYVTDFVPKIDNWAVCDSFCTGLKFTKDHRSRTWDFLQTYLTSTEEYSLRFGIVMLLDFYIEDDSIEHVLQQLDRIKHEGYYVKMAVAWAVSICFIKYPELTMKYLKDNTLDNFTYNKALQKITESYRIDQETKNIIRSMKRKQ